ncbi:MAG: nitroreductase/quinone reductase family protein [Myxococcota bacterium]
MLKAITGVTAPIVAYIVIALALNGAAGVMQPPMGAGPGEGILTTYAEDGSDPYDRRLAIFEDEGALWVVSVQRFRQWYERLVVNPTVDLDREGTKLRLRAVPIDDDARVARLSEMMEERVGGTRFLLMRTLWMFADWKVVRLDPMPTVGAIRS